MEDTLGGTEVDSKNPLLPVLILVLMEDTLGDLVQKNLWLKSNVGLNPCFNGRYSRSLQFNFITHSTSCLNPCFNGRYSRSVTRIIY